MSKGPVSQLSFLFGTTRPEPPTAAAPEATVKPKAPETLALPLPALAVAAPVVPEKTPKPAKETPEQAAFAARLAQSARLSWEIHWTHNRRTMISYVRSHRPPLLRLQSFFVEAPPSIIVRIAEVIEGRKKGFGAEIDQFIRVQLASPKWRDTLAAPRPLPVVSAGRRLDLAPLFAELNDRYFEGRVVARLGFLRGSPIKRRGSFSLKLGTYAPESNVIRLHPALELPMVPSYVVRAVLFHEMAHAMQPELHRPKDGRRHVVHNAAFKRELARFPETEAADRWIREHLRELLGAWTREVKKNKKS